MAQAKILTVGGTNYEMIDDTARTNATTALNNTEYNRQGLIGKYPGQSLATLLAGEVSGSATIYDALHKRVQAANFSGMRVGDYIDVPLVSASNVAAQQSVRFLLAHFDPYYQCGDSAKGHHIAFIASAPVAVAKTVTGVANTIMASWKVRNSVVHPERWRSTADTNRSTCPTRSLTCALKLPGGAAPLAIDNACARSLCQSLTTPSNCARVCRSQGTANGRVESPRRNKATLRSNSANCADTSAENFTASTGFCCKLSANW